MTVPIPDSRINGTQSMVQSMHEPTLDRLDQKLADFIEDFERHDTLEREFQKYVYEQLIKLDRLGQIEAARKWHIRTMWGAWIAATLGWLYSLLHSVK